MANYAPSDLRTRRATGFGDSTSAWAPSSGGQNYSGGGGNCGGGQGGSSYGGYGVQGGQNNGTSDDGKEPGIFQMSRERQLTLVLLFLTAACLHADQNLAAPNLSAIAIDFEMTPMQKDSRLGGLVQFGFFLIGGTVSIFIGPAADQFDRVYVLCGVLLCGCIPSLLMSFLVPSSKAGFFYFFLARICTGVAIGGSFPVLFSLSADVFPASQRALISGAISAAGNIGSAVGALMAGVVGPKYGWRTPFTCVSVPTLICAALCAAFLNDPRTAKKRKAKQEAGVANEAYSAWLGGQDVIGEGHISIADLDLTKFQKVLSMQTNMIVFSQALPGCIPISVIVTFLADYLATDQGMSVQASTSVTAVFGVSCLCFGIAGGALGQTLYNQRKKDNFVWLMACGMIAASFPFMALVNAPKSLITSSSGRPTFLAFFLAVCGGCAAVAGPNIRLVLMNVNPSERRGTVFSAFTLCDDLGKGLGPTVVVTLVSIFGRRTAFTVAFFGWWVSAVIISRLVKTLPTDASRGGDSVLPTNKHV